MLLSDLATRREYIAAAFAAAEALGADIYEMCVNSIPSWTKVGVATVGQCKGTLEAAKAADLTYRCGEYPVMSQWGYADDPGHFDHWGAGHIHTFPNEGSANGVVVFQPGDIVILPYCRYVHDEVRLEVRDGVVRKVEGGLDARLMTDWLDDNKTSEDDLDPYAISHLGWGMNPQSLWYGIALNGDEPERSRAAARTFPGNFLFSTGPNTQGGGKRNTRGHYDVPMRDCTVILDNDVVVERGRIVDENMIVERVAVT